MTHTKIRGRYSATARNNPDKVRIPAITVGIRYLSTTYFGGIIGFHNADHFHSNRIDDDVVLPIKALNDVTYNDINEKNGVQKQVFHPNSIGIQDKCRTFAHHFIIRLQIWTN